MTGRTTEVKTVDESSKTSTSLAITAPESTESSIRPAVGGPDVEIELLLPPSPTKSSAFSFLAGIRNDLKARAPLYWDDWKVAPQDYFTVLNATVYTFMVQLIPALIFAELLDRQTEGKLAVAETLMSSGIIGIIYAVFAGQPLVIMGVTGPVAILLGTSYKLAHDLFDAEYFPFFWWTCVWAALLHIISACIGVVDLVFSITPFTLQIFELFIASAFIYSGVKDLITPVQLVNSDMNPDERSAAYTGLLIGLATTTVCWFLHFADQWRYFTRHTRAFLSAYNMVISIVIVTAISYLPGVDQHGALERVHISVTPWNWRPTQDRNWWTDPFDEMSSGAIFGAFLPGLMFYLLFFIDHNASSILSQVPKYNLKKPAAYHWDFLILGITFLPCGFLGLPPGNGLIPQAPLHTRSLCTKRLEDIDGVKREVYTSCAEQRFSGFLQAALMFVALSCLTVVSWIPVGSLFGVLLYLGIVALEGNAIWERLLFHAMLPSCRPPVPCVAKIPSWSTVRWFTLIQVGCTAIIFCVAQFARVGTCGFVCLPACWLPIDLNT